MCLLLYILYSNIPGYIYYECMASFLLSGSEAFSFSLISATQIYCIWNDVKWTCVQLYFGSLKYVLIGLKMMTWDSLIGPYITHQTNYYISSGPLKEICSAGPPEEHLAGWFISSVLWECWNLTVYNVVVFLPHIQFL